MAEELKVVGKPYPRIDGPAKVTGSAKFAFDASMPGMLYAKLLHPTVSHARIKSIDTSKAEALPGVTVITSQDKDVPPYYTPGKDGLPEMPILATDKVRYCTDIVAAAAAESEELAQEALKLIEVEYERLPLVMDPEEAMQPGAPLVHDDREGNIASKLVQSLEGDVEAGFAEADYIIEKRFSSPYRNQSVPEPHGALVWWDEPGKLSFLAASQCINLDNMDFSLALGLPISHVRGNHKYVGGGFGCRFSYVWGYWRPLTIAACLAKKSGKPVKCFLTREEVQSAGGRQPIVSYWKVGFKADGSLTAIEVDFINEMGPYSKAAPVGWLGHFGYSCPNIKKTRVAVYTNRAIGWYYRGVSGPQIHFAADQLMDEVAETVGMNPLDYMLQQKLPDVDFAPINMCAEAIKFREKWHEPGADTGIKKHGIGIGMSPFRPQGGGWWSAEVAVVRVQFDGSVILNTTTSDIGQGTATCLLQMCAEDLGAPWEKCTHEYGDSAYAPYCSGSYGSHAICDLGPAVRHAAQDAKRQLLENAAKILGVTVEELAIDWEEAQVYIKATPEEKVHFNMLVPNAWGYLLGDIVGTGYSLEYPDPAPPYVQDLSCVMAEVEVDTETGQVEVLSLVNTFNIGKAINTLTLESNLLGGSMQAIRHCLSEDYVYDEATGKQLNANLVDYRLSTIGDVPTVLQALWNEYPDPIGPYGAKGMGEWPICGVTPALANAVYNAIGVRITEEPMTPDKILKALGKI